MMIPIKHPGLGITLPPMIMLSSSMFFVLLWLVGDWLVECEVCSKVGADVNADVGSNLVAIVGVEDDEAVGADEGASV